MDKVSEILYIVTLIISIVSLVLSIGTLLGMIKSKKRRNDDEFLEEKARRPLFDAINRVIEVIFVAIGLIVFSPVIVIISIAIKMCTRESVFEKYEILGKDNCVVQLYKFRTKSDSSNKNNLDNIGTFLTQTALKEIPLLINVLKGDIALFGLAQIKHSKVGLIEQMIPDIKRTYNYYKPGLVSMFSLSWNVTKGLDDEQEYYAYMHQSNIDFLMNRSVKHLMLMQFRVIYLLFKPFDQE